MLWRRALLGRQPSRAAGRLTPIALCLAVWPIRTGTSHDPSSSPVTLEAFLEMPVET